MYGWVSRSQMDEWWEDKSSYGRESQVCAETIVDRLH